MVGWGVWFPWRLGVGLLGPGVRGWGRGTPRVSSLWCGVFCGVCVCVCVVWVCVCVAAVFCVSVCVLSVCAWLFGCAPVFLVSGCVPGRGRPTALGYLGFSFLCVAGCSCPWSWSFVCLSAVVLLRLSLLLPPALRASAPLPLSVQLFALFASLPASCPLFFLSLLFLLVLAVLFCLSLLLFFGFL